MTSHDSAFAAWAAAAHEVQRWSTMSAATKTEIAESHHEPAKLAQRVGTAGNSGDVHVVMGQGKDGVGAAGGPGTGSIGLPLFSRGRSREQRMRDSVIDAEIRAGLARSAALIAARRDSVRADSLRADSLRKVAQARRP
jgi:subtilisin family serine protease